MATHVELYEALKPYVGEEAASMIAEVVPPAGELATKADIARLELATREDIARLEASTRKDIARLELATREELARLEAKIADVKGEIYAAEARMSHKLLAYFIPLWIMMGGQALAIVGLVATRL